MGFCRRCGDIVPQQALRCRCGGTPVAPANPWSKTSQKEPKDDKWSKTYTTPPRSRTNSAAPTPTKSPLGMNGFSPSTSLVSKKIDTSPLCETRKPEDSLSDSQSDILVSPEDATLAKVYGSILQPISELPIHSCALCHDIFPPDATIYPDLSSNSQSDPVFLCRSCFIIRGGSKGRCKACFRDILVVASEGGFVEFAQNVWHKRCFRCESCGVDISHSPMVDIFGKPSCQGCFDTCTIRSQIPIKTPTKRLSEVTNTNNLGGIDRGRRGSNSALDELSNRLGISLRNTPTKVADDPFLVDTMSSPSKITRPEPPGKLIERENTARSNDLSDTSCKGCSKPLLTRFGDGKFVTVPDEHEDLNFYHLHCFRCGICQKSIDGSRSTPFVRNAKGICHLECADSEEGRSRGIKSPLRITVPEDKLVLNTITELQTAPPALRIFPRFGDSEACPGCQKAVSIMEVGVVSGPQGKRWHKVCLVCGGKGAKLPRPGCGKVLDSSAKLDTDGGIWCRECMLLLPLEKRSSPQNSPTRKLALTHTGQVASHFTGGTTTLAHQITGTAVGLLRSGSISPTRQLPRSISPTKGLKPVGTYSRLLGARNKSVDEGRGMFLVRQMTGSGQR